MKNNSSVSHAVALAVIGVVGLGIGCAKWKVPLTRVTEAW